MRFLIMLKIFLLFIIMGAILCVHGCKKDEKNLTPDNFSYTIVPGIIDTVYFKSIYADSTIGILWDFGDGTTSMLHNPVHSYPGGTFFVKLYTIYNSAVKDSVQEKLSLPIPSAISEMSGVRHWHHYSIETSSSGVRLDSTRYSDTSFALDFINNINLSFLGNDLHYDTMISNNIFFSNEGYFSGWFNYNFGYYSSTDSMAYSHSFSESGGNSTEYLNTF